MLVRCLLQCSRQVTCIAAVFTIRCEVGALANETRLAAQIHTVVWLCAYHVKSGPLEGKLGGCVSSLGRGSGAVVSEGARLALRSRLCRQTRRVHSRTRPPPSRSPDTPTLFPFPPGAQVPLIPPRTTLTVPFPSIPQQARH